MKVRDKVLKLREEVFKQNEEEVSKRWIYEEGVSYCYYTSSLHSVEFSHKPFIRQNYYFTVPC